VSLLLLHPAACGVQSKAAVGGGSRHSTLAGTSTVRQSGDGHVLVCVCAQGSFISCRG
jgi:hypothetical protein